MYGIRIEKMLLFCYVIYYLYFRNVIIKINYLKKQVSICQTRQICRKNDLAVSFLELILLISKYYLVKRIRKPRIRTSLRSFSFNTYTAYLNSFVKSFCMEQNCSNYRQRERGRGRPSYLQDREVFH